MFEECGPRMITKMASKASGRQKEVFIGNYLRKNPNSFIVVQSGYEFTILPGNERRSL